jgi:predicted RNA-binding Zn ribbon-like protein
MNFSSKNADAIEKLSLVGGRTCLDFTNTVSVRDSDQFRDHLESYGDLLHWAVHAGILTAKQAGDLSSEADRDQKSAGSAFQRAIELREVIFRIFSAIAAGRAPSDEDLGLYNQHFSAAMSRASVTRENGRYAIGFDGSRALDGMLAPIAWSAAELLRDPASARVKECDGETCGWLFLDTSKNHSRRWCEMRDCGNRAKAHRHYQKLKRGRKRERRAPTRPREA